MEIEAFQCLNPIKIEFISQDDDTVEIPIYKFPDSPNGDFFEDNHRIEIYQNDGERYKLLYSFSIKLLIKENFYKKISIIRISILNKKKTKSIQERDFKGNLVKLFIKDIETLKDHLNFLNKKD